MPNTKPIKNFMLSVYENTELFLLIFFGVFLVTVVLLGILARYVHFDVVFATELGKYVFIWLSAIGISAAARDNQHIRINFIANRIPIPRKLIWVLSQLLFLFMTIFFLYWGFRLSVMHFSMNKSAMGFNFPIYVFTAALPVGFGLTTIRLISGLYAYFRNSAKSEPWLTQTPDGLPDN